MRIVVSCNAASDWCSRSSPYNGAVKYDADVKVAGDTPVEVTLHTEGMPGIQEKWLTTSGSVVISSANGQAVSGTVEADLSSTQKKSGAIHLAGTWSCTLEKYGAHT